MLFNAHHSQYTFIHTPRNRNTYILVTKAGEVVVKSPLLNEKRIRQMLHEKETWIQKKIDTFQQRIHITHEWGKTIRFRGTLYAMENFPALHAKTSQASQQRSIEKHYADFYRAEAMMTIPGRVRYYSEKMALFPSEIRFKKMSRRWGSCDSKGIVTFNTMMMQLSYEHIDYIIVHELAHLRHMNHSKEFHHLVRSFLQNERELRRELKAVSI